MICRVRDYVQMLLRNEVLSAHVFLVVVEFVVAKRVDLMPKPELAAIHIEPLGFRVRMEMAFGHVTRLMWIVAVAPSDRPLLFQYETDPPGQPQPHHIESG